ncbi:DNA polymerase zeta catalytic subunit-like protein [Tanacetum coccineum]
MESSEAPYWKEAIQSKIDSVVHNNTWKLVDLPSGHKPIGHKWIFKKKLRLDGTIEKYKACLVAKGYRQKEGKTLKKLMINLGIRIQKNSNGYILTQSYYIEQTLKKFGHYDNRPVVTPFDPKVRRDIVIQLGFPTSKKASPQVHVIYLKAAISWRSSKQTVNTRSTMKAEFVALDKAAEEA